MSAEQANDKDFPRMLYRAPGADITHQGCPLGYKIVKDQAEQDEAEADGWHPDPNDAKAAYEQAKEDAARNAQTPDSAKPTRAELEQKATELGIAFKPATSDKKLAELIAAKLAEAKG